MQSNRLKIDCLQTGMLQTNCYCLFRTGPDGATHKAVIDPGDDIRVILSSLSKVEGSLDFIFLTHAHFDHLLALSALKASYPEALVCIGEEEPYNVEEIVSTAKNALGPTFYSTPLSDPSFTVPPADRLLKDGQEIFEMKVLHTPGHTKGSICLLDEEDKVLFSGDTMFCGSHGRTDLGGDMEDMKSSLMELLTLDPETTVLSGHDGPTTIGEEKGRYEF